MSGSMLESPNLHNQTQRGVSGLDKAVTKSVYHHSVYSKVNMKSFRYDDYESNQNSLAGSVHGLPTISKSNSDRDDTLQVRAKTDKMVLEQEIKRDRHHSTSIVPTQHL